VEAVILRIATGQLNVVALQQLLSAGLTRRQVRRRVAAGSLVPLYRGVYLTVLATPTLEQRVIGACLAAGAESFASHLTALAVLGIADGRVPAIEAIEVTVPIGSRVRVEGVLAHRSGVIGPRERARRGPIAVSRPARALIDSAGHLPRLELERAVEHVLRERMVSPRALVLEVERAVFASRPGIHVLRGIASERADDRPSESVLEDEMKRLIGTYGLPRPVPQYEVRFGGRNVRFDLAYPDHRVAVELNGWAPHYGRDRWQRDHDRRNTVELGGWRLLEFTWQDVTERQWFVVSAIGDALGIRPARWTTA
jgi:hypothetical protein